MESLADAHCVDSRSGCSSEHLYNSPMGVQDCSKKSNAAGEGKGEAEGLVGGQTTLANSKQLKFSIAAAAKNDSSNAQNASKKASELADGLTAKDETRVDSPPPFDARKSIKELCLKLGDHEFVS